MNRNILLLKTVIRLYLGIFILPISGNTEPENPRQQNHQNVVPQIPPDIEYLRDIEYGKGGNIPLKLDIIRSKNRPQTLMPVIVFIHGGGWQDYSSRVQAVCDWFGPSDFLRLLPISAVANTSNATGAVSLLLGGPVHDKRALAIQASPVTYVSKDDPPFLIMHGDIDKLVPLRQSEILYDALKKAGVEVTFKVIKGEGHGGPKFWRDPESRTLVEQFFEKNLKNK
ncbi:MAG: prolyl oligopeptidase family serine peptidase [bacterium]|nr:prolyl oligopeptidase family serine peptidase [bacterium]